MIQEKDEAVSRVFKVRHEENEAEEEQNFTTLLDMINASEAREDDEEFKNPVDLMFDELEEREPDHFAVKQYKKYKLAAGVIR